MDLEQYLVPLLIFLAVLAVGSGILLLRGVKARSVRTRLGPAADATPGGIADPQSWILRLAGRLGQRVSVTGTSENLRTLMVQAGYQGDKAAVVFLGVKLLLSATAIVVFGALTFPLSWPAGSKLMAVLFAAGMFLFVPNLIVRIRRDRRQAEIRHHFPDAVDLLEICVSGGMGLEMAWNVVTDEISQVCMLLGDEMAFTNLEIHLGASRSVAMRHMSERTGCNEIGSLSATITQSEQFGTSIGDTLRVFASTMRDERSQRAAEAAEKMAVKLLFPLILLLFPAMIIVVAGPAAMILVRVLGSGDK